MASATSYIVTTETGTTVAQTATMKAAKAAAIKAVQGGAQSATVARALGFGAGFRGFAPVLTVKGE